jgi:hypothetical protein
MKVEIRVRTHPGKTKHREEHQRKEKFGASVKLMPHSSMIRNKKRKKGWYKLQNKKVQEREKISQWVVGLGATKKGAHQSKSMFRVCEKKKYMWFRLIAHPWFRLKPQWGIIQNPRFS